MSVALAVPGQCPRREEGSPKPALPEGARNFPEAFPVRKVIGSAGADQPAPWHFLYFLPEPQGQGSLRPTLGASRRTGSAFGTTWPA